MKLNLGCGKIHYPGYVNIDIMAEYKPDKVCDVTKLPYKDIEEICAWHLLEHFDRTETPQILKHWFDILAPKGKLVMEVPDLDATCKEWLKSSYDQKWLKWRDFTKNPELTEFPLINMLYGDFSIPHMGHKTGFSAKRLIDLLESVGFKDVKLKTFEQDLVMIMEATK